MQNWHEERLIIWTLSLNDPGGCFECLRQCLCHAHLLLMPSRQQVYWQGSLAPLWRQSALLLLLTFKVLENTPSRFDFWTVRLPGRRIKIHQTRPRTLKSGGHSLGVAGADRFIILREGDPPSRKCRRASHAGFVGLAGSYREGGGYHNEPHPCIRTKSVSVSGSRVARHLSALPLDAFLGSGPLHMHAHAHAAGPPTPAAVARRGGKAPSL